MARVNAIVDERSSLRARLEAIQLSARYRLGSILVDAIRSPRSLVGLPQAALVMLRERGVFARIRGVVRDRFIASGAEESGSSGAEQRTNSDVPPVEGADATELFVLPPPPPAPARLADLRIAAVLDPFSIGNLRPECDLLLLDPDAWVEQIRAHPVHLLLVESAWTGSRGQWAGMVDRASQTLGSLVASCREAGIPTAFWNKEDPLHYRAFLPAAALCDHVFTTDVSCMSRYRQALGHDRIHLLPFALQPKTHNPIAVGQRHSSSVFAGAWYGRLRERCMDFETVADALALAGPLTIHDRNSGGAQPHQRFPDRFSAYLKASVTHEQTADVFRSHTIGINLNTIKQSPTMFARRVLELMGCNASVYGNCSQGVLRMFGELTVASDDAERLLSLAYAELQDPRALHHELRRLRALRKVLREHTWAHRLGAIFAAAFPEQPLPVSLKTVVWVVGSARDQSELDRLKGNYHRQLGVETRWVVDLAPQLSVPEDALPLADFDPGPEDWIALMHPLDCYGPHYLEDLVLARAFAGESVIGKASWLSCPSGAGLVAHHAEREYRAVDALSLRRCLFRRDRWSHSIKEALQQLDDASIRGEGLISLSRLEYLEAGCESMLEQVGGESADEGISLEEADEFLRRMAANAEPGPEAESLSGSELAGLFQGSEFPPRTSISRDGEVAEICSLLDENERVDLTSSLIPRAVLERGGRLDLTLQAPVASQLQMSLSAVDDKGQVLCTTLLHRGLRYRTKPCDRVHGYRISLSMQGTFVRHIEQLWLEEVRSVPLFLPGRGRILLLCNGYPEQGSLYRNAFLHRRVLAYRRHGTAVDVVWVSNQAPPRHFEYDGVSVVVTSPAVVAETLKHSQHVAIGVHFLDAEIWEAVHAAAHRVRVVVWLHGSEIQSWRHREFNHRSEEERALAKSAGTRRDDFWRALLADLPSRMHLVFVSAFFAEQTWSDLGVRLPADRWSVVHNPIDTGLFRWSPKPAAHRYRILSIRPHASRIYANDLVAQTIRLLSSHELFNRLEFTLIGDGPLWEEDFAGLEEFGNVRLVRRFISQAEIAREHASHGIFLVPTRGDTQGVSRDEAMASGLVPVTCDVGAVGEFLDARCGILCQPEDPQALADAIVRLVEQPEEFVEMSNRAAERVRRQSDIDATCRREMGLLLDGERRPSRLQGV